MSSRKQQPPPLPFTDKKYTKNKPHTVNFKYTITLITSLSVWFLILFFWFPTRNNLASEKLILNSPPPSSSATSPCPLNMSVYMYDLPPEFNLGLVHDCRHLSVYTDMCLYVVNSGLGRRMSKFGNSTSWFATYQFIAEMIFHARVEHHPCRTRDPSRATLFYVPFYGGLDASSKFRETNVTARDGLSVRLGAWLEEQPYWNRNNGKDHFLALGRTSWDFMRVTGGSTKSGGNCLLNLPPVQNMSVLTVERNPWNGSNQFGIPYPSYFHPFTSNEMFTWQDHVRQSTRPYLFSFIGGPRKGLEKAAIRDELIKQCAESTQCELVNCDQGLGTCHSPIDILNVMKKSRFCLQAPGDSFTRRSTFDSVLSGCIPVFFSPHTAYTQYLWFFPGDRSSYSVFIDEKSNASRRIEEELSKISDDDVEKMREMVIGLIPRVTYAHPTATVYGGRFFDAVDVALSALAMHVRSELESRGKLLR